MRRSRHRLTILFFIALAACAGWTVYLTYFRAAVNTNNDLSENSLQPVYFGPPRVRITTPEPQLWSRFERNRSDSAAVSELAFLMAQKGQWQDALKFYQKWMRMRPAEINAIIGCAYALVNLGKPREAIAFLQKTRTVLKTPEAVAFTWHVEGDIWWFLALSAEKDSRERYLTTAEKCQKRALEIVPHSCRFYLGMVRVALAKNDLTLASKLIDQIYAIGCTTNREQALASYYKGVIHERLGDLKKAQLYYSAAISADPESFIDIRKVYR